MLTGACSFTVSGAHLCYTFPFSLKFTSYSFYFSLNFPRFCPQFGTPDGRLPYSFKGHYQMRLCTSACRYMYNPLVQWWATFLSPGAEKELRFLSWAAHTKLHNTSKDTPNIHPYDFFFCLIRS